MNREAKYRSNRHKNVIKIDCLAGRSNCRLLWNCEICFATEALRSAVKMGRAVPDLHHQWLCLLGSLDHGQFQN